MSQQSAAAEVQMMEDPPASEYPLIFNHDFKRANWKQPAKSTATSGTSRSPSPVTPSEGSNCYAESTTSSWATSAGPATECGFPNDDDRERWGNKPWDDDGSHAPRMPPHRPPTPADRFARSLRKRSARSPSRPSSLRNSFSARDEESEERGELELEEEEEEEEAEAPSAEYQESESDESAAEESGCESDGLSEDEDEDDNEWSGENGNLESLVISAVGLDYSLAAHLIPLIHRDFNMALKSKVESWRCATSHGAGEASGQGDPSASANTSPAQASGTQASGMQASGNARKRRRANSNGDVREDKSGWNEDEDDDQKEQDNFGNMGPPSTPVGPRDLPLLACPFHKKDPIKYNMHRDVATGGKKQKYRPCTGPGFKSIQRLKEHLRRTHSPVQCERCKETFNPGKGGDRAEALNKLAEHRKSKESCPLRDASLKEGVDEVQWAKLDKQNRRKNAEAHRVEKWFEIWDVLFPGVPRPDSPWHEIPAPIGRIPTGKDGEDYFAELFENILNHKILQGDIPLPDPSLQALFRDRLRAVVQNTFRMYVSIRENLSPETSSSQSHDPRAHSSLVGSGGLGGGGSSTQRSATLSLQRTATTAPTSIGSAAPSRTIANPAAAAAVAVSQGAAAATPAYALAASYSLQQPQYHHLPAQFAPMAPEHDPAATNHAAATYFYGSPPNMFAPHPQAGYCQWVPAHAGAPAAMAPFPPTAHLQATHSPHQAAAGAEAWYNFGDATAVGQGGFVGGHHGDFTGHHGGEEG